MSWLKTLQYWDLCDNSAPPGHQFCQLCEPALSINESNVADQFTGFV